MKLRIEQLDNQLKQGLSPVYLISGDESLLVQESCDKIRKTCREQGFTEREVHDIDARFKWDDLLLAANSMSLFADRKLIECRFQTTKLGKDGSEAIQQLLAEQNPDNVFLFIMPKLDASTQRSKWHKLIESDGVTLPVWPIERAQLPRWIQTRLRDAQLNASDDAVNFLADNVEGNLLAAQQEIEKLKLLAQGDTIDLETMASLISNSSRYTIFNFTDRCLSGDTGAALKTLQGLRAEGTEPPVVLWSITRELRTLHRLQSAVENGMPIGQVMKQERIFQSRQRIIQGAMQRLSIKRIEKLLFNARDIDKSIKGLHDLSPWLLLEKMTISFSR